LSENYCIQGALGVRVLPAAPGAVALRLPLRRDLEWLALAAGTDNALIVDRGRRVEEDGERD